MAHFLSGTVERRQYNKTFKILQDKNCLSKILYPLKISLKNRWDKELCRYIKSERIHSWQCYMTRKVKGSPSGIRKIVLDTNMDLHKEMMSTKSGKYITKYIHVRCFIFIYISSKDLSLLKRK